MNNTGNPNYENPYISDSTVAELTIDDLQNESTREIIEIIDDITATISDWDILGQMKELGEDYENYDDDEFADAIINHVVMSIEADRQNLIAEFVKLEASALEELEDVDNAQYIFDKDDVVGYIE